MNENTQTEFKCPQTALVTYEPSFEDQMAASDQGLSGQFKVEYDVKREQDAGQVMVGASSAGGRDQSPPRRTQ